MLFLKLLLKFKGIKKVDAFLHDDPDYLYCYKDISIVEFINLYLKHSFDSSNPYPFAIFSYIKKINTWNWNYTKLINTTYFNSMPSSYVIDALLINHLSIDGYEDFVNYMIAKLENKDIPRLKELSKIEPFTKSLPALVDKLTTYKDIDLIIALFPKLNKEDISKILNIVYLNYNYLDIKKFALSLDSIIYLEDIIYWLLDNNKIKDVLDILIGIDAKNQLENNNNTFLDFVKLLENDSPENEYIPLLAEEILNSGNFRLMYYWVITIDCIKNYEIIDNLLLNKNLNLSKFVLDLDYTYAEYVVRKICNEMEIVKLEKLVEGIFGYVEDNVIEKVDYILSLISYLRPTYEIPKGLVMNLLVYDTRYYRAILENYEFSLEERQLILSWLHLNKRYDLIAIYGSYLLSGDKNKLVAELIISDNKDTLKRLRTKEIVV